ncbi:PRD domain-containing protein [Breznakia blatticola]|uniref:PRD domain-containing protein n=2 Tax=Breznakia blatticola TaxID=1754012 RepID=A0A4V3G628_9FIRM|nr:PRD domain-containing protein [Breznakia blatticola]
MNIEQLKDMKNSEEYLLAVNVVSELEQVFDIEIPDSEVGYLAIHFSGKQFIEIKPGEENFVITSKIDGIVKHILSEVKSSYNIDFTNDFELRMSLALHLVPMDIRLKHDMFLRNPLLGEIKQRYTLAYMLATSACGVLKKHYKKDIYEDEISYIALHFNLALERNRSTIAKKNIVIVCATGRGSSSLLVYRFKEEVGAYLNRIEACDVGQLKYFDFDRVDYVITTVPIPFSVPKPILEVQFFLDEGDVKALKNFLSGKTTFSFSEKFDSRLFISHLSASTKEEVIRKMVDRIKEVKTIPNNFYDLVMKRESMAVTAFGNLVAIPHPCEVIGDETFVCIAILDEPIIWESVEVQFIFMMSMKKDRDENMEAFSTMISRLLLNPAYIQKMIQTRDYQTLANCFNQIEEEMRSE